MNEVRQSPRNCAECAYWQQLRDHEGLCRRYAPEAAIRAEEVAHWPQTHSRQGCAEGMIATARSGLTCASCRYWRGGESGLNPTDRGDMSKLWWSRAGFCTRHAPRPVSEPGPRAFWKATANVDCCGEGVAREVVAKPV